MNYQHIISHVDIKFLFGFVAHSSLVYLFFQANKHNYLNVIFHLIGHIFISIAMFIRINTNSFNHKRIISFITGGLGHLNLLFYILKPILTKSIQIDRFVNIDNILFIIGQIGMVYVYISEYTDKEENLLKTFINTIIFIMLFVYYFRSFRKTKNIKNKTYISLGLVGILYMIFILINTRHIYNHHIK